MAEDTKTEMVRAAARAIYDARSIHYGGFVASFDEIGEYRTLLYTQMAEAALAQRDADIAKAVEAGIEKARRYVQALFDAHTREFGVYDPSTNAWEFDGSSEEIDGLYQELVEGIAALRARIATQADGGATQPAKEGT